MQECSILPECREKFRRIEEHESENYMEIKLIQKDLEYIKLSLDNLRESSKEYSEDKKAALGHILSETLKWAVPVLVVLAVKFI